MTFDLTKLNFMRMEADEETLNIYGWEILSAEEKAFCVAFWSQPGVYGKRKIKWESEDAK